MCCVDGHPPGGCHKWGRVNRGRWHVGAAAPLLTGKLCRCAECVPCAHSLLHTARQAYQNSMPTQLSAAAHNLLRGAERQEEALLPQLLYDCGLRHRGHVRVLCHHLHGSLPLPAQLPQLWCECCLRAAGQPACSWARALRCCMWATAGCCRILPGHGLVVLRTADIPAARCCSWMSMAQSVGCSHMQDCLALGAILAATDSVAALQVIHQDRFPLLYSMVFGEGVINDATSIVILGTIQVHGAAGFCRDLAWLGATGRCCSRAAVALHAAPLSRRALSAPPRHTHCPPCCAPACSSAAAEVWAGQLRGADLWAGVHHAARLPVPLPRLGAAGHGVWPGLRLLPAHLPL